MFHATIDLSQEYAAFLQMAEEQDLSLSREKKAKNPADRTPSVVSCYLSVVN